MKTQDIINMGLAWKQVTEMSSKEKMKKGLYNSNEFVIPEDVPMDERDMFMAKAAAAHKAGKSHFSMPGGKKHPVTMQKTTAKAVNSSTNEEADYPHPMYDPKSGKKVMAKTPADHNKFAKMGYTHEKPDMDEDVKEGDAQSADKKPQMYVDPASGKKKVRMVPTDDKIVDKDAKEGVVSKVKSFFKKPEPKPEPDPMKTASDIVFNKMSKMKLKDNRPKEGVEENQKAALAKKLAKSAAASDKGKAAVSLPKAPFEIPKKESVAVSYTHLTLPTTD